MKISNKISKKFGSPYNSLGRVKGYFDNADDLGWAEQIKSIDELFELYWIMNEELDNGGFFSDWCELMHDAYPIAEDGYRKCEEFNKHIGIELFNPLELKLWYND